MVASSTSTTSRARYEEKEMLSDGMVSHLFVSVSFTNMLYMYIWSCVVDVLAFADERSAAARVAGVEGLRRQGVLRRPYHEDHDVDGSARRSEEATELAVQWRWWGVDTNGSIAIRACEWQWELEKQYGARRVEEQLRRPHVVARGAIVQCEYDSTE